MKTKMKNNTICVFACLLLLNACREEPPVRKRHELELSWPGNFFYLDQVKNKQVMQIRDAEEDALYASYVIGFMDSGYVPDPHKPEKMEERLAYYRFHMGDRWKAIVNGDSLVPVFFQPVHQADNRINAGVIVFQVEKGASPDTLMYGGDGNSWNAMTISLKQHKIIQ